MSRATYNEGGGSPRDVLGLPDVYRISPRSSKFSNNTTKRDFTNLDYDRTHFLVKINAEVQRNAVFSSRAEYFAWWDGLDNPTKDFYIRNLTSACAEDRSHNNEYGLDNKHNYLNGARIDKEDARFFQIITSRLKVKGIIENGEPLRRNVPGVGYCLGFDCINFSLNDPLHPAFYWNFSPLNHPYLFDRSPLITGRDLATNAGGRYIVRDDKHYFYGQFNDRLVFPITLPYDNIAFIPIAQVRRLRLSEPTSGKRLDNSRKQSNL